MRNKHGEDFGKIPRSIRSTFSVISLWLQLLFDPDSGSLSQQFQSYFCIPLGRLVAIVPIVRNKFLEDNRR
ncbi:MAG: hypothetical protein CMJ62_15765 [Planctomycetaceae bacterium]|nr:hypothetical protein [Planctomycetaceae bacterium]